MKNNKPFVKLDEFRLLFLPLLLLPLLATAQDSGPTLVKVADARMQSLSSVVLVPGTVVSRDDAR
ncbi:MAG TPA: hypothetical protein VJN01_04430, partial [Xanthomonadales bacterium]|nr:hypothetical protein [Xanthomonadales bacterium]